MRTAGVLVIVALLGAGPAAADYRETTVTNGAKILGQVRVTGDVPALPLQPVFKETDTCGTELPDERLTVGKNGALKNAMVSIINITSGKAPRLADPVKLDNLKCTFVPHVLTATVGQTLQIHNSDPFLHNAHALMGSKTLFNVGVMSNHTVLEPLLDAGLVHINCNIRHTWMHAYLYVADNPYHTVTDADGHFVLDDVPPGNYTVRVWHELLGSQDRDVKVLAGETSTQDVTFSAAAPPSAPDAH